MYNGGVGKEPASQPIKPGVTTMSLNLDKTTRLQFAMIDRVSESNAATLTAIAAAIGAVQAAKDGAKAANEDKAANIPTIWGGVLNIVEAVTNDEAAKDLDATQLGAVLSAVVQDALTGEAVKTVKAYLSTGKKVVTAVKSGKNNLHQFRTKIEGEGEAAKETPVSYEEARDILKSAEQKSLDKLSKDIAAMIGKIRGRENDVRSYESRSDDLLAIMSFLSPMVTKAEGAADAAKKNSKAAKAASELRQQQPETAGTVEVVTMQRTGIANMNDISAAIQEAGEARRTGTEG